ncbi:MAG TPA: LysR family transcriptional regulator [Stellaceae bacterium]|nr:LysR family transcriptional regulator [Stellaceae bacterium]
MALNLHLLRLFAAVAEHGSFSHAADALHVSQPAVSKGVREFESQVGTALLERGAGGVRPTEAGQRLLIQARALFAAERAAEEELDGFRGLQRGSLAIGASTTIATYLLPPLLGAFSRRRPEIELHLTSANTRAIAERLVARELDIALVEGPTKEFNLRAAPWRRDELALIAAPDHRLARLSASVVLTALEQEIFLIREPGSGTREVVASALAKYKLRPRRTIEIGSTEAIKQMVASGFGVAIVSAAAAIDQIALKRLTVIRPPRFAVHRALMRLTLHGRPMSAAAAAFDRLLDDEAERATATDDA